MLKFRLLRISSYLVLNIFLLFQLCSTVSVHKVKIKIRYEKVKHDRPIPCEPITPADFERGRKIVLKPLTEDIDDGTMDDIVEPAGRAFGDRQVYKWPNSILPYVLDGAFTETDRAMIARAIQLIQESTCFKIIPRTNQRNYTFIIKNGGSVCNSQVGMKGGKQDINVATRCLKRFGSTAHEFLHAMGFYHEHARQNRDSYLNVKLDNIKTESRHNFDLRYGVFGNMKAPYDLSSIMHYSRTAFSINGKDTLIPLKDNGEVLGQREKLTKLDLAKVNIYYNCKNIDTDRELTSVEETECRDYNPDCKLYASYNFCTRAPKYMMAYCRKTCNQCDMGCVDLNDYCGEWRRKNYCNKYVTYMDVYCAKTCELC